MFVFDVETLGKKSDSVILSMAAIYFNPDEKPSPQQMRDDAFYAKFDVKDQHTRLNRHMGKSTMEWWKKQCDNVKKVSFVPNEIDCVFEDGYEAMRNNEYFCRSYACCWTSVLQRGFRSSSCCWN